MRNDGSSNNITTANSANGINHAIKFEKEEINGNSLNWNRKSEWAMILLVAV